MSDYESDDENVDFSTQPRGYLYEPEYTDAELHQMELDRTERERGLTDKLKLEPCTCFNCDIMKTEVECYCCHEWDLVMPEMQNLSIDEDIGGAACRS